MASFEQLLEAEFKKLVPFKALSVAEVAAIKKALENLLLQKRREEHLKFWDKDSNWSGEMSQLKNLPKTPKEEVIDELLEEVLG